MSAVNSTMLELGTRAPDFSLEDVRNEKIINLKEFKNSEGLMVIFICNHCPYVKLIKEQLVKYANDYSSKNIAVVAISSNDIEKYPQDAPDKMKEDAERLSYPFPYLFDETQEVAKAYKAACTPDLFLFDKDLKLFYRGQFDSSRPKNNIQPNGYDLRKATDLMLENRSVPENQIPSIGCNIKWKEGNEPEYYG